MTVSLTARLVDVACRYRFSRRRRPLRGGSHTYMPADFAQFAPQTALDMLNRVPGFAIKQEEDARGLGQATGNVVINGQRLSGKSNDVVTELSRIPARNVERIEIVDGATLKIPGLSGQVANVIVRSTGISGQWRYRPEFRSYYTDPLLTRFDVSVQRHERTGAVHGRPRESRQPQRCRRTDVDLQSDRLAHRGATGGVARQFRPAAGHGTFRVTTVPSGSKGNLNLLYHRLYFDYLETGIRTPLGSVPGDRKVTEDQHGDSYEIGGDYEFGLGIGKLKLIGLSRGNAYPDTTTVETRFGNTATPTSAIASRRTAKSARALAAGNIAGTSRGAEWQISAEGAFNSLNSTSGLFEMNPSGGFDEIPLPGGTARVQEDRYEVIGSYGRKLATNLTMKLSAGEEYSQLAQVGAGGTTRTFYRPKGELSAAWKFSPKTDINVKLARKVGQLNFFDFLASVDLASNIEKSANPDLVPEAELGFPGRRRPQPRQARIDDAPRLRTPDRRHHRLRSDRRRRPVARQSRSRHGLRHRVAQHAEPRPVRLARRPPRHRPATAEQQGARPAHRTGAPHQQQPARCRKRRPAARPPEVKLGMGRRRVVRARCRLLPPHRAGAAVGRTGLGRSVRGAQELSRPHDSRRPVQPFLRRQQMEPHGLQRPPHRFGGVRGRPRTADRDRSTHSRFAGSSKDGFTRGSRRGGEKQFSVPLRAPREPCPVPSYRTVTTCTFRPSPF